jgi:hypothetical protein
MALRTIDRYLAGFAPNAVLRAVFNAANAPADRLVEMGFEQPFMAGQSVVPSASLGPSAKVNSEGRTLVRRDLPMETAHRQIYWEWTEWHGPYQERKSDVREQEYQRYPREVVAATGIEFHIAETAQGDLFVTSPEFSNDANGRANLLVAANVLRDAFGSFEIVAGDFTRRPIRVRRLNWEILPRGQTPWAQTRTTILERIGDLGERTRHVIFARLDAIGEREPDFTAIGRAGFSGYIVFGFEGRGLYILESAETDNATYVFDADWEALSQLTKAEIIEGNLHVARLIHRQSWFNELAALFARFPADN